jgi:hypothetical protein
MRSVLQITLFAGMDRVVRLVGNVIPSPVVQRDKPVA